MPQAIKLSQCGKSGLNVLKIIYIIKLKRSSGNIACCYDQLTSMCYFSNYAIYLAEKDALTVKAFYELLRGYPIEKRRNLVRSAQKSAAVNIGKAILMIRMPNRNLLLSYKVKI